jgi:hypothetical protein
MVLHDRSDFQETMGHIWQGFARETVAAWAGEANLLLERHIELPADPQARGPSLFAAVARRTET